MPKIVVSHRREEMPAEARRIRDSLAARVVDAEIVTSPDEHAPARQIALGDVLIALVGPRWMELMRGHAARGEQDATRADIASALRHGLMVIPVRVGRADALPEPLRAEELPVDIRALAQRPWRTITLERLESDAAAISDVIRMRPPGAVHGDVRPMAGPVPVIAHPSAAVAPASSQPPAYSSVRLEPMPGNSHLKALLWAAGIFVGTMMIAHLVANLVSPLGPGPAGRVATVQPGGQPRVPGILPAWTGEGRLRRAIDAALAKGRRPEEAQRCQTALMAATDTGTIVFETASADLDARSHRTLDNLAQIIRGCPDFVIEIEGHTDSAGDPQSNQRLSERRARAVRDYLVQAGVPGQSLSAIGHGETRPIAPNDTPANMARNRRIELNATLR